MKTKALYCDCVWRGVFVPTAEDPMTAMMERIKGGNVHLKKASVGTEMFTVPCGNNFWFKFLIISAKAFTENRKERCHV